MAVKTYVLLDSMDADAPIFQQLPNNQREKIRKIPRHRPYMQVTFENKEGESTTIRYKASSKHILLKKQMDEDKIDANAKFTQNERDNLWFRYGVLTTDKLNLQQFLEAHPEYDKFEGTCDDVKKRCYKLLDKAGEAKLKNNDTKLRVNAAYKIINMDLAAARELLLIINGSYFETPNTGDDVADLEMCQNMLTEFLDDTNEEGLKEILKDRKLDTIDEKVTILVGKLINADHLSFDAISNAVSKKAKDGNWMKLRDISSTEYTPDQRMNLFSTFLNTEDGKLLREDLEKDLAGIEAKAKKKIE